MIALVLLLALLALLVGGRRLGGGFRGMAAVWRPTTGLLSVLALMAAAVLAVREDWWLALALGVVAGGLALGARSRAASTPKLGGMSANEACAILGVAPGASPEAVDAAYRRLMLRAHPDQGGTAGLAAQLNAARAVLRTRPS